MLHKDDSISKQNMLLLEEVVNKHGNGHLQFVDVSGVFDFEFNNEKFRLDYATVTFTEDSLYQCCATFITEFDKYDQIIYSDVDIVVVDDISELGDLDLGDKYLAGVNMPEFIQDDRTHLDSKFKSCYIAGGIWVMNLKKMREDKIAEKALEIIKNPPARLIWLDQDVINLACDCNVKFLSCRYISVPDWLLMLESRDFYDKHYPDGDLYDTMFRPKIVHYAGPKPWSDYSVSKADLWHYWLSKTPFADVFQGFKQLEKSYMCKIYLFGFIRVAYFKSLRFNGNKIKYKLGPIPLLKIRRSRL